MLCPVIFRLQSTFTDSCYHQQEVVDPGIHRNTDPYWLYWDKRKSLNIYLEFLCHPLEPSKTRSFPIKPNVSWVQVNIGAVKLYRCNRSAMLCKIYVSAQNRSTFFKEVNLDMGVSKNSGTPKSSILIGFSIINHPFWGTSIFGNTHFFLADFSRSLIGSAWLVHCLTSWGIEHLLPALFLFQPICYSTPIPAHT